MVFADWPKWRVILFKLALLTAAMIYITYGCCYQILGLTLMDGLLEKTQIKIN